MPVGSAAKGSALVNTGGAGGAPTVGPPERRVCGVSAPVMKATVANLTVEDMTFIAAYLASLSP